MIWDKEWSFDAKLNYSYVLWTIGLLCSYTTVIFLFGEYSTRNSIAMHAVTVRRFLVRVERCAYCFIYAEVRTMAQVANGTNCSGYYTPIHCFDIKTLIKIVLDKLQKIQVRICCEIFSALFNSDNALILINIRLKQWNNFIHFKTFM